MDYYIDGTPTTTQVNYKLLDASGKTISTFRSEQCFSGITYQRIPSGAKLIRIYHEKHMVPYKVSEIRRWVSEMTELGFAMTYLDGSISDAEKREQFTAATIHMDMCDLAKNLLCHGEVPISSEQENNYYHFEIKLDDYKYKAHLVSALMLLRCLTESLICKIPDIYFKMLDADPSIDKFDALQTAHKTLGAYNFNDPKYRHNYNHMITYQGNGSNVKPSKLLERYKNCGVETLQHNAYNTGQAVKWNGDVK